MSDINVPLDRPIPLTQAIYAWSEQEGIWLTWPDYVFRAAKRPADPSPVVKFEEVS